MEQTELVYFFYRELIRLNHFSVKMLSGLIAYAKRHEFSEQYRDEDFRVSAEIALNKIKEGVKT